MDTSEEVDREVAAIQADRAKIQRQLEDLEARMAPLQDERRALVLDLRAADELIAELAVTDAEIVASRDTQTGNPRFESLVKGLHAGIMGTFEWSPKGDWSEPDSELSPGPRLWLRYGDDADYNETLADALVEFARRFLPDLPDEARTDIPADLLDHECGEYHAWQIRFDPAARTAVIVDKYGHSESYGGTLPAVIAYARKFAWGTGGPDAVVVGGY